MGNNKVIYDKTMKSSAVATIKAMIGENNRINDLRVQGKWLIASVGVATQSGEHLAAGINFWVLNK